MKVVNGKLQVVALHRFRTINEKSRAGSIFTEILRHACFVDGEGMLFMYTSFLSSKLLYTIQDTKYIKSV